MIDHRNALTGGFYIQVHAGLPCRRCFAALEAVRPEPRRRCCARVGGLSDSDRPLGLVSRRGVVSDRPGTAHRHCRTANGANRNRSIGDRLPSWLSLSVMLRWSRHQAGSWISLVTALATKVERVMPRVRAASSIVSRSPLSRLRLTRTIRRRGRRRLPHALPRGRAPE